MNYGEGKPLEIKPCPFCGGKAQVNDEYTMNIKLFSVMCTKCFVKTMPITGIVQSVTNWNRRVKKDDD